MKPTYSETGGLVLTPDFGKSDVICRSSVIGIRVQESQATRRIKLAYAWTKIGKFLMASVLSGRLCV